MQPSRIQTIVGLGVGLSVTGVLGLMFAPSVPASTLPRNGLAVVIEPVPLAALPLEIDRVSLDSTSTPEHELVEVRRPVATEDVSTANEPVSPDTRGAEPTREPRAERSATPPRDASHDAGDPPSRPQRDVREDRDSDGGGDRDSDKRGEKDGKRDDENRDRDKDEKRDKEEKRDRDKDEKRDKDEGGDAPPFAEGS